MKKFVISVLCSVLGLTSAVAAEATEPKLIEDASVTSESVEGAATEAAAVSSPYKFSVGLSHYRETYTEYVDGAKFMSETAPMTGVALAVSRKTPYNGELILSTTLALGQSSYVGAYMGGTYGDLTVGGLDRNMVDTTLIYKQSSPDWNNFSLSGGFGYRVLTDHLEQGGPGGYLRETNRLYAVLGIERVFDLGDSWTVTPQLSYQHVLHSTQASNIIQGGVTVSQPKGTGSQIAVAIANTSTKFPMVLTPFYRTWTMQDSHVDSSGFYEPKNKTSEIGVTFSIAF